MKDRMSSGVSMFFFFCVLLIFPALSWAGTTVIEVRTEGSGDINKLTGEQNLNGAMVWNGTEWIVNNTWAHKFFVDTRTGQRLKDYTSRDVTISGAPDPGTQTSACGSQTPSESYGNFYPPETFLNYTITKRAYTYVKQASAGNGSYCYGAAEYVLHDNFTGKEVILKSRGVGSGTGQAYFDVYIDDELNTSGSQTTAMRGDPAWFTYPGVTAQQAKLVTDRTTGKTGDLPGAVTQLGTHVGDYYLDIGGGSDLGPAGVGKSFELHTSRLADVFLGLSPAYITGFELKWMDGAGNLQKITVSPTLFKEVFFPAQAGPSVPVPTLNEWGMILFMLLAGAASLGIIARQKNG